MASYSLMGIYLIHIIKVNLKQREDRELVNGRISGKERIVSLPIPSRLATRLITTRNRMAGHALI